MTGTVTAVAAAAMRGGLAALDAGVRTAAGASLGMARAFGAFAARVTNWRLLTAIDDQRRLVAEAQDQPADTPKKFRQARLEPDWGLASKGRRGAAQRAALQVEVLAGRRRVRKRRVGL